MRRNLLRAVCLPLALVLALGPVAPVAAEPAAPVVTLSADIASPDGQAGWWRTSPETFASSDQDAVLHFDWGDAETTRAVTAGSLTSLGFAPEGESTVTATAVNSAEETSLAALRHYRVDSEPPLRPEGLQTSVVGGVITLSWDAVGDGTSGLGYYAVYRNLVGPPFSESDLIATVPDGTTYADVEGSGGIWFYAVRAVDVAGNGSLLSASARTSADVAPPTAPGDLQAWLNGLGAVRVSWEPSYDAGTGVASYVVVRAFPGQEATVVATVPAGSLYWDDTDLEAVASDCSYVVYAIDRVGYRSADAGPVSRGIDTDPPSVPAELVALGDLPIDGHPIHTLPVAFELKWVAPHDGGSGVVGYDVSYGPDAGTPAWTRTTDLTTLRVTTDAEWADWWFSVRAEDRAGNVSSWTSPIEQRVATFDDVFGSDRVATAVAASAETFASATDVVVASSRSFPDGLAASSLAGALHAPVLLVGPGTLRTDVSAEIERLGAAKVWVVGGAPSVSEETFGSLEDVVSGEVTRVAGVDRYATAAAVASAVRALRGSDPAGLIVVSGENYPDALSAGPVAYVTGWPLVFARAGSLPAASRAVVASSNASETLVLGGTGSVWGGVESVVPSATRLAGADRYATSAMTAEWATGRGFLSWERPVLTIGTNFPDGLSAGPFAGERHAPLLLSRATSLSSAVKASLQTHGGEVRRMTALGGSLDGWTVYVRAWRQVQMLPDYAYGL